MGQIQLLSDTAINQISAGEVISSPVSCMKELVENSLDAGAKHIDVSLEEAGFGCIEVKDDGVGMAKSELPKAILRHATSKLTTIADLDQLTTLGFRGEALAAIASVSDLTIQSCQRAEPIGNKLIAHGGKEIQLLPAAPFIGCLIQVRKLFFNAPVRKRVQKSKSALIQEAASLMRSFAIARCDVAFCFKVEAKVLFQVAIEPHLSLQQAFSARAAHLFSEEFLAASLWIEEKTQDKELFGLIAKPTLHRPKRTAQKLILNERIIYSKSITEAIEKSYSTSLPIDRYPLFCLHLKLKPEDFDVNIHPQKSVVHLRNERGVSHFIQAAIQGKLFRKQEPKGFFSMTTAPKLTAKTLVEEFEPPILPPFEVQILASLHPYCLLDAANLLPEAKPGWLLVDIPRIWRRLHEKNKKTHVQPLLFPLCLEFSFDEKRFIEKNLSQLLELGFELTEGPNQRYLLLTLPDYINEKDAPRFMQALTKIKKELTYKEMNKVAAQTKSFSLEEKKTLIKAALDNEELQTMDVKPLFCLLTKSKIEKIFDLYGD